MGHHRRQQRLRTAHGKLHQHGLRHLRQGVRRDVARRTVHMQCAEHVVQQDHRHAVLHERPPQATQSPPHERPPVTKVLLLETIPADKEEQRHVEHIDIVAEHIVNGQGMACHHQDDGNSLDHTDDGVPF